MGNTLSFQQTAPPGGVIPWVGWNLRRLFPLAKELRGSSH